MRAYVLALLAASAPLPLLAAPAPAPAPSAVPAKIPFVRAEAEAAVRDLAAAVEESFVFPEIGTKYAAMLRSNLAAGKYASFADAEAFATQVTEDLRAVHKDGHLRLRPIPPDGKTGKREMRGPPTESAVAKSGWLADGIAYIDFKGFPGNDATLADVRAFIAKHKDAKTLIIDARANGGGGLAEMNLLFAEIFAEPTTLVVMDIRQAVEEKHGSPFGDDDPLLRKVAGPDSIIRREHFVTPAAKPSGLRNAKVYLLTSKDTFSAAEHLSLSLKRTRRATLVGEATGGGAHFGGMAPMGTGYAAFIPVGRTFDPDNGQSWEGVGVQPDVAVAAEKALDEALRLAGAKVTAEVSLKQLR